MRPRKVVYVANSLIPSRQANTAHVLNMSAALGQSNASVTLIARGVPSATEGVYGDFNVARSFDIRLIPLGSPKILDRLLFLRDIRKAVREGQFDFAYGRSWYGLMAGVPVEIPFAYDLHDFPTSRRQKWWYRLLFRRPNLLFVTVISKALADRYSLAYPCLRGRILIAPCAAKAPARLPPLPGEREPGPFRVYYVGHLYAGRGIELIVELARLESEIEFHIVGGESEDIAYWKSQAPTNVHFHGYVRPVLLDTHYDRADICLAPYGRGVAVAGGGDTSAGMSPMKIFEYMAHAKAMIASDLPVLREVITDNVDGVLCPPGDVQSWRRAILDLREDPHRTERLGTEAFQKFQRDFTWGQRAKRILNFAAEFHSWPARNLAGFR